MQAHTTAPNTAPKPLGNFEVAPEFNDTKDPLDVVYEHYHCHYVVALQACIRIASSVLRGMTQPQGRVDLAVVDGDQCIYLSYSPEEARTLARLLLAAADDADAAHAVLCAEQQGGAA